MKTTLWRLGIVAATIAFAGLKLYGLAGPTNLMGALLAESLAYVLAIVAVFGLASLAFEHAWTWLAAAVLGALALPLSLGGGTHAVDILLYVAMITLTATLLGVLIRRGVPPIRAYISGLAVATAFVLALFLPNWPALRQAAEGGKDMIVDDFESSMTLSGYSQEYKDTLRDSIKRAADIFIRLIPASTVLSGIVQVSVGFLWFGSRIRKLYNRVTTDQYVLWKVPFGVLPLVIVFSALRLMGGETATLIADNALAILAMFYCVAGLALVEFMVRRLNVGCFMKGLFYVMLALTQLFGLILISLLGFADSFADWRKIAAAKIALKS